MCGRFANAIPPPVLMEFFAVPEEPTVSPHWNIAPSQTVPVVKTAATGATSFFVFLWTFPIQKNRNTNGNKRELLGGIWG